LINDVIKEQGFVGYKDKGLLLLST
jgi:hypothetical protein